MNRGDWVAAEKLKVNDRFCFKMGVQAYRCAEISDKIYYVNSGMRNNDRKTGYKVLVPHKMVYFLRNGE